MIRKILMVSAIAVVPVATVATFGATGVASAKGLPPAPISCTIGGSLAFGGSGLSQDGVSNLKTSTSTANLTSSTSGCGSSTVHIVSKSSKCTTVTPGSLDFSGTTIHPDTVTTTDGTNKALMPVCATTSTSKKTAGDIIQNTKGYDALSVWGFAGGIDINGSPDSAASSLPAELKKGISFTDGTTPLTLLVSSATGVTPGGVCGSSEVGFQLNGTVKKYAGYSWTSNICLGSDSGTHTSGAFYSDVATMIVDSAHEINPTEVQSGIVISSASIDSAESNLVIAS